MNRATFQPVFDKINSKLASWKCRSLSLAGRITLVRSVISVIHKIIKAFIWGSWDDRRRMHLVSWADIYKRKEDGGLGIWSTKAMNLALIAKVSWLLLQQDGGIWTKILIAKYIRPSGKSVSNSSFV
ncbi:hypothetical protein V2J09_015864 [Rumex salicifolius]